MVNRFQSDTALLVVDAQRGVNELTHWGGAAGRRNNPQAEASIRRLLDSWRKYKLPVFFTQHDSREAKSPLKLALHSGSFIEGLEPRTGECVIVKDVNGGFIGTNLEINLRRRSISRLVVAGFFTNMCVETTVRQAGNMGFDTYLVEDACATTNRIGPDGQDYDPETVHALAVANMSGEFCTVLCTDQAAQLVSADLPGLDRARGNRAPDETVNEARAAR
ncbi:MAG: cysteine hydrolase [Gammaproteobacteria bacterium]|nr:cysteine hydrolase [Gammaproteobacteria bacterium]